MFGRLAEVYDSNIRDGGVRVDPLLHDVQASFDAVGRYVACLHSPVCPVDTDWKVLSLFLLH